MPQVQDQWVLTLLVDCHSARKRHALQVGASVRGGKTKATDGSLQGP